MGKKLSFSKKWVHFMVRHPGAFLPSGVADAKKRLNEPVHIHAGQINRASFKPGDIFINYNDSFKHNPFKIPQALTGNIQYSSFAHGGIIISNTHIMHAGALDMEGPIVIDKIDDEFNSKREYRVFRPKDAALAEEIVEVALDLHWNKHIPFAGLRMPNLLHPIESFRQARMCKGDRGLLRFSNKSRTTKNLTDIRAEYEAMLRQTPSLDNKIRTHYTELETYTISQIKNGLIKMSPEEMQTYLDVNMEFYLSSLTPTNIKVKKFFCTQFVTWVIQAATGVLHERDSNKFKYDIPDVLDIRDTKATPARLAEILKQSPHFIEFKSEESYANPIDVPILILGVAATDTEIQAEIAKKEALKLALMTILKSAKTELKNAEAKAKKAAEETARAEIQIANAEATINNTKAGKTALSLASRTVKWLSGYHPWLATTSATTLELAEMQSIQIAETEKAQAMVAKEEAIVATEAAKKEVIKAKDIIDTAQEEVNEVLKRWPFVSGRKLLYEALTPPQKQAPPPVPPRTFAAGTPPPVPPRTFAAAPPQVPPPQPSPLQRQGAFRRKRP